MLPVLLLLNAVFFLTGFQSNQKLDTLNDVRYHDYVAINSVAILLAIVLLIIWLIFYMRQNAVKNTLPLSKFHIVKEFLIIFIVFTGLSSFMVSHMYGRNYKTLYIAMHTNLEKEKTIVALAMNFLPFSADDFSSSTNDVEDKKAEFSYLNYSGHTYTYFGYNTANQAKDSCINAKAKQLLLTHDKTAILKAINDYLLLCKKYGANYHINVEAHVNSIFATPNFKIAGTLLGISPENNKKYYIETDDVRHAINKIQSARENSFPEALLFVYYFAIGFTVILFSFRITAAKTWLIAVVSAILLIILVSIFGISAKLHNESMFRVILSLGTIVLLIAIGCILAVKNKQIGGAALVLFLWYLPALVMTVYGLISSGSNYYYANEMNLRNWNIAGIVFTFLFTTFIIVPLAKKWQSNPQE